MRLVPGLLGSPVRANCATYAIIALESASLPGRLPLVKTRRPRGPFQISLPKKKGMSIEWHAPSLKPHGAGITLVPVSPPEPQRN